MNIESFLHYWNGHNTTIIEILIGLVVLLLVLLSAKFLRASDEETGAGASQLQIEQLEKVLKNFTGQLPAAGASASGEEATAVNDPGLGQIIEEKDQAIKALQDRLKTMEDASKSAATNSSSDEGLLKKIKELEERLSEYEIISEDIADLSRFREENGQLKADLEKARAGLSAAGTATQGLEPSDTSEEIVASSEKAEEPKVTIETPGSGMPEEQLIQAPDFDFGEDKPVTDEASADQNISVTGDESAANVKVQSEKSFDQEIRDAAAGDNSMDEAIRTSLAAAKDAQPENAASTSAAPADNDSAIDDDLMKEFAAAVQDQKAATASEDDAPASENLKDNEGLINEFEKFVTNKS